jgi:hypothetical protein
MSTNKNWNVSTLVKLARQCHRSARSNKGRDWLAGHSDWERGRASAFLLSARLISGTTAARYRNARKREMERQAADLCGVTA